MSQKRFKADQIIRMLREAEVAPFQRSNSGSSESQTLGLTDRTYYRWRKEYGGIKISQVCLK